MPPSGFLVGAAPTTVINTLFMMLLSDAENSIALCNSYMACHSHLVVIRAKQNPIFYFVCLSGQTNVIKQPQSKKSATD